MEKYCKTAIYRRSELIEIADHVANISAKHEGGEIDIEQTREHPTDILDYFRDKEEIVESGDWDKLTQNFLDKHDATNLTARELTQYQQAFIAAKKVGQTGRVIGIDITEEMITKARENAEKYNYNNIEFKLGDIEQLPLADCSVDKIISNCVINLAPNKEKVFKEAHRVLKENGIAYISDIVLLEELTIEQRNDPDLIASCVGGAILRDEYLELIKKSGFEVKVTSEDKEISERQYNGLKLESLKVEAIKI